MDAPLLHAVCFDAYGTLCRIGDRRDPYRTLFRMLGVEPRPAARLAMTSDLALVDFVRLLVPGHDVDLGGVISDLEAEVRSVSLFEDAADCLDRLHRRGLKLWVASNLTPPYAVPLRAALRSLVDGFCFSCEVGAVKPEPVFFERLCSHVGCRPGLALMVGDSPRSDVEGARAAGMGAVHLARDARTDRPDTVRSLAELALLLEEGHVRPVS